MTHYAVNDADPAWEKQGTLSQKAIRALPAVDCRRDRCAGRDAKGRLCGRCSERTKTAHGAKRPPGRWAKIRHSIEELFQS